MTKLQEQLKTVAEYDGKANALDPRDRIYHYDAEWSWQIPAWSKALKEVNMLFGRRFPTRIAIIMHDYHKVIDNNSPSDGLKVLVELIQFVNKHKA